MLENSFGISFFLKTPEKKNDIRFVYLRVTVDGIPKETSTKRKWDARRWDQKSERAIGSKEDARTLNHFLDSMVTKVNQFKTDLMNSGKTLTTQGVMDFIKGKTVSKAKILEEFQLHNDEMEALIPKEYSWGTLERFNIAMSHVRNFIAYKYNREDMEFRELNYEFVKDYEFYLKTVKKCANNTALKYIANFKKIVLRAVAKEIIDRDPFILFKGKKTKPNKKPLSKEELRLLEDKVFSSDRLSVVRDVFVFQCYTGLAYADVFKLTHDDIKIGIDGELWISSARKKTTSPINVPLLPKAREIMNRYKDHPDCAVKGLVLPVRSNQKMNEYLKEIAVLCGISSVLNTHKARRTFGSTVTLNNGVPIHVVKEMLGHHSVKQTEEYALTEQEVVGREMTQLRERLTPKQIIEVKPDPLAMLKARENEIGVLKNSDSNGTSDQSDPVAVLSSKLEAVKALLLQS